MRNIKISIMFIGLVQCAILSAYNPASLKQHIFNYISSSENLDIHIYKQEKEKNNYLSIRNKYDLSLQLRPYYQKDSYTFLKQVEYGSNSYNVETGIVQTFKSATKFSLLTNYDLFDRSDVSTGQKKYSYSLLMEQPLLKNAFGGGWLKLEQYHQKNHESLSIEQIELLGNECQTAISDYLKAYISQENLSLRKETNLKAKKVLELSRKNYKRKLISKINFLTAETDYLELKDNLSILTKNHIENVATIKRYSNGDNIEFENPIPFLSDIDTARSLSLQRSIIYQKLLIQANAKESYYEHIKNMNRPDLNAFIKVGKSTSKNDYTLLASDDSDNKFIMAGVSLSVPLINKNNRTENANAFIDKEIAYKKLSLAKREYVKQVQVLIAKINHLKDSLQLKKKKLVSYKKQSQEAFKLLIKAKIEFKDYVIYRDKYVSGQINNLNTFYDLTLTKLKLLNTYGIIPNLCKGIK